MPVIDLTKIPFTPVIGPGVEGAQKKLAVAPADGWEGWAMRVFELAPGGKAPAHQHPWPHIIYFLEGEGTVMLEGVDHPVSAGFSAYIPADAYHQIKNRGDKPFKFICIVPEEGEN